MTSAIRNGCGARPSIWKARRAHAVFGFSLLADAAVGARAPLGINRDPGAGRRSAAHSALLALRRGDSRHALGREAAGLARRTAESSDCLIGPGQSRTRCGAMRSSRGIHSLCMAVVASGGRELWSEATASYEGYFVIQSSLCQEESS